LEVALSALPVAAALACLLVLRRSTLTAGAAGAALALALVLMHPAFALAGERLVQAALRGLLIAWLVAYVLLFGLILYNLLAAGGAIARIGVWLAGLPGGAPARALVLALPIGAFVEAVSGFGVSIVVVAPLIAAIGFAPRQAALLALFTPNAVPWGALAVGVVMSEEIAGLPANAIGIGCAYLGAPLFVYFALLLLRLAGGWDALRANLGLAIGVGLAMAIGVWGATVLFGVELGMVVAGPLVAAPAMAYLWLTGRPISAAQPALDAPPLTRAFAPYGLLVALLLGSRLVGPMRDWLQRTAVLEVPGVGIAQPLLYSPGFWLLLTCLATVSLLRLPWAAVRSAAVKTRGQWLRAAAALAAFALLAELMLQSGMTDRLAGAVSAGLGPSYVLAAPAVAALSGFMTGSNAAGSAMLLPFQLRVAEQLGLPSLVLASSQNAAAAAASMASPQRVVLAAAVMGLTRESDFVRRALSIELGAVALITAAQLVWLLTFSP